MFHMPETTSFIPIEIRKDSKGVDFLIKSKYTEKGLFSDLDI